MSVDAREASSYCVEPIGDALPGHEVLRGFDLAVRPEPCQFFELGVVGRDCDFQFCSLTVCVRLMLKRTRKLWRVEAKQDCFGDERFERVGKDADLSAAEEPRTCGADVCRSATAGS